MPPSETHREVCDDLVVGQEVGEVLVDELVVVAQLVVCIMRRAGERTSAVSHRRTGCTKSSQMHKLLCALMSKATTD